MARETRSNGEDGEGILFKFTMAATKPAVRTPKTMTEQPWRHKSQS